MNLSETQHSENMHACWAHGRRYVIMTRTVSAILLLTSGLVMHTTFTTTGSDMMGRFNLSYTAQATP